MSVQEGLLILDGVVRIYNGWLDKLKPNRPEPVPPSLPKTCNAWFSLDKDNHQSYFYPVITIAGGSINILDLIATTNAQVYDVSFQDQKSGNFTKFNSIGTH